MSVMVIPCSGAKLDRAAPARELYVGSMFRFSLAAALKQCDEGDRVLILSALHGLVELDAVLDPYECKIGAPEAVSVEVLAEQAQRLGIEWDTDVWAFLPKAYFAKLDNALRSFGCYPHFVFEGSERGIGEHRRVLANSMRWPA